MGFFQDFKKDLSQAVNELLPDDEADMGQMPEPEEDENVAATLKEVEATLSAEVMSDGHDTESDAQEDAALEAMLAQMSDEIDEEEAEAEKAEKPQEAEAQAQREEAEEAEEEAEPEELQEVEAQAEKEEAEEAEKPQGAQAQAEKEEAEKAEKPQEAEKEEAEKEEEAEPEKPQEAEAQDKPDRAVKTGGKAASSQPVMEAAAAQIAGIAGMVVKDESARAGLSVADYEEREEQPLEEMLSAIQDMDNEESEIEKEVGKVVEEQKMNLADEAVADETAIITAGMEITGDVVSKGNMDVQGSIFGNLEILGKLNVSGKIMGDSKAAEVFADSAKITGKVVAEGTVKIGENSVVIGNIEAASAVIAGAVKGDLDVQGPVILDTSAIVMGNIKSKSVQINNGAVIEGMCSQCYAEVNPTSFFDNLIAK